MRLLDSLAIMWPDKIPRSLKKALGMSFAMKDLLLAKKILGMHIVRDRTSKRVLWLQQQKYVTKILERFNMLEAKANRLGVADKL